MFWIWILNVLNLLDFQRQPPSPPFPGVRHRSTPAWHKTPSNLGFYGLNYSSWAKLNGGLGVWFWKCVRKRNTTVLGPTPWGKHSWTWSHWAGHPFGNETCRNHRKHGAHGPRSWPHTSIPLDHLTQGRGLRTRTRLSTWNQFCLSHT